MIAGPVCETHRLGYIIDILLKSFIQHVKNCVGDDIDFLIHVPDHVKNNTSLVSFVINVNKHT